MPKSVNSLENQLPILVPKSEKNVPILVPNSLNQLPNFVNNSPKKLPILFIKFVKPSLNDLNISLVLLNKLVK